MNKSILVSMAFGVVAAGMTAQAVARDYISIVGSSTVYPFSTVVAERFGKTTEFKTPKVESTGSGGGLKLFCEGLGPNTPDITNASRRIKSSEVERCTKNGVTDILEVLVGYDGIAIANAKGAAEYKLSRKELFLALAKRIPGPDGKLIENPNETWKDVNAELPATKIEVLGPPPTSGTRDAFAELAMGGGAKKFPILKKLRGYKKDQVDEIRATLLMLGLPASFYDEMKEKKGKSPKGKDFFKAIAYSVREDGAFIEAGENDNLIVQKLNANPNALGIFGFSFLDQNSDKVQGSVIDGFSPTFEAIASGDYPVSRPLYFYVKKAHIGQIPGIEGYVDEFASDNATGEDGYLIDKGLIPLGGDERAKVLENVKTRANLSM